MAGTVGGWRSFCFRGAGARGVAGVRGANAKMFHVEPFKIFAAKHQTKIISVRGKSFNGVKIFVVNHQTEIIFSLGKKYEIQHTMLF